MTTRILPFSPTDSAEEPFVFHSLSNFALRRAWARPGPYLQRQVERLRVARLCGWRRRDPGDDCLGIMDGSAPHLRGGACVIHHGNCVYFHSALRGAQRSDCGAGLRCHLHPAQEPIQATKHVTQKIRSGAARTKQVVLSGSAATGVCPASIPARMAFCVVRDGGGI